MSKFKKFIEIDEDEKIFYDKCIKMLLEAGYFRARIPALSPFDKIVGGLCWAISNANVDVEVGNLYFHEEPSVGQKAAISDGIIRSLKLMGCPIRMQSVQVLGLDLKVIQQVFGWLLKKVIETREENVEGIKKISNLVFNNYYTLLEDIEKEKKIEKAKPYLNSIRGLYEWKRRFISTKRRKTIQKEGKIKKKQKWEHVQGVLLEYGKEFHVVKKGKGKEKSNQERTQIDFQLKKHEKAAEKRAAKEKKRIERLKTKLIDLNNKTPKVKREAFNKIFSNDKDVIADLNDAFETEKKSIRETVDVAQNIQFLHTMNKKKKKKQILKLEEALNEKKNEIKTVVVNIKKKQVDFDELKKKNINMSNTISQFNEKLDNLNDEDKGILKRLRKLIELNENLKRQEKKFKLQVKNQNTELDEEIKDLKTNLEVNIKQTKDKASAKIEKIKELVDKKFAGLKKKMMKENKREILINRRINEIPTSSELNQFEKRFSELIIQMVNNDKETRKYFDSYNTYSKTLEYTEKKYSLFSSILEKYEKSLKVNTKTYSNWVLESVGKSLQHVKTSSDIVQKKSEEKTEKASEKDKIYSELVAKKRDYFRCLKEIEDHSKKNEILIEKLEKVKQMIQKKHLERMQQIAEQKKLEEEKRRKEKENQEEYDDEEEGESDEESEGEEEYDEESDEEEGEYEEEGEEESDE